MIEVLGFNLSSFFQRICTDVMYSAKLTFKNNKYEVWSLNKNTFNLINDMSEEEFVELAGDDAYWRFAEGSNQDIPCDEIIINNKQMCGWNRYKDIGNDWGINHFYSLTDYLCIHMGASQPRNVCALCVDLASANHITMAELFKQYEPDDDKGVEI